MTDQSLFGNEQGNTSTTSTASAAAGTQAQNANPLATLLAEIRNEGGAQKYNSVEDALKGAAHAQSYIAQLKQEKEDAVRRLQEATQTATTYQAQLTDQEQIKASIAALTSKLDGQVSQTTGKTFTPEEIAELVNSQLTQREGVQTVKQNQATVVAQLRSKFGEKAEEQYNAAAAELGMTPAELNALAGKSPKAVLKALGIAEQPAHKSTQFVPGQSAVNTAGFQPHQESFVGRNKEQLRIGATTQELAQETVRAKAMVAELEANGMSIDDLTIPKNFFKLFK